MRDKFSTKSKTAYALHKHKVIQNKKRILAVNSDWLKRKLELMIWQDFHERVVKKG
jgi:hypothetical protein